MCIFLNKIVLQFAVFDYNSTVGTEEKDEIANFSPSQPREKWQRKTTFIKIKVNNSNLIYYYYCMSSYKYFF